MNLPISTGIKMLSRINQFVAAVKAKITPADNDFIGGELTPDEQGLFYGMSLPDQRHALNVAYTALGLAANRELDLQLLVRGALLHDVGRQRGDVSTGDKIITVLARRVAPHRARRWARAGKGDRVANLRHAFHVHFHHPERSARFLAAIGEEQALLDIVRRHHEAPAEDDPQELTLLRQADNLN